MSEQDTNSLVDARGSSVYPRSENQELKAARSTSQYDAGEITISEVVAVLRNARWSILAVTVGAALLALSVSLILPKEYRASVLVAPVVADRGESQLASFANALPGVGNVTSMLGIASHGSNAAKDVAILKSQVLTRKFITENHLLPVLYARLWDAHAARWRADDGKRTPTLWKANQLFKYKVRAVALDEKTDLIRLTITWRDPRLAAAWANGLISMANDYLRSRAIREANREIAYLANEAKQTSIVTVRQGIYQIMEQEIANEMVAQGRRQYALRVIDPAFTPQQAASPRPLLWVLSGLLGGLLFSCGWAVFRASWRESR